MKPINVLLIFTLILSSCNSNTTEEKIDNLNGYWEIKRVEKEAENPREYSFNQMIDYIQIDDQQGVRRKVRPQFDGSFIVSEDEELFSIKVQNDSINLYYKTPFSSWKETLVSSSQDEIEILNQYGIRYTYQRFTPYLSDYDHEEDEE